MDKRLHAEIERIVSEGWTDGISIVFGTSRKNETINYGFVSGQPSLPVSEYTIYDLASVTKLFTLISTLKLAEKEIISLDAQIGDYSNKFHNIRHLHIYELMNFSRHLYTDDRIDSFADSADATNILYDVKIGNCAGRYSDIGAIVLGMIIDSLPGISFKESVYTIINQCNLENTYWWTDIPKSKTAYIQSYDNEHIIQNNQDTIHRHPLGIPHDKKAEILGISGHAGLFSTPHDIAKFSIAILSNEIISARSLNHIIDSKYDYQTDDGQHFGLLCYKKAIDPTMSEIPPQFSDCSFAISGYTGTYLLIDLYNKCFVSINSNRIFNRCPGYNHCIDSTERIIGTKNYVYRKDAILKYIAL